MMSWITDDTYHVIIGETGGLGEWGETYLPTYVNSNEIATGDLEVRNVGDATGTFRVEQSGSEDCTDRSGESGEFTLDAGESTFVYTQPIGGYDRWVCLMRETPTGWVVDDSMHVVINEYPGPFNITDVTLYESGTDNEITQMPAGTSLEAELTFQNDTGIVIPKILCLFIGDPGTICGKITGSRLTPDVKRDIGTGTFTERIPIGPPNCSDVGTWTVVGGYGYWLSDALAIQERVIKEDYLTIT